MRYLLDVSVVIALIWRSRVDHERAWRWRAGKRLALCPITELGFIRVSTRPAFGASMGDARRALADFIRAEAPDFIPCDRRALEGPPSPSSRQTTDWYLANLAEAHGMRWATLDTGVKHPAAETIGRSATTAR